MKIMKYVYLEYCFPIKDFISTQDTREKIFDWLIPVTSSALLYIFVLKRMPLISILNLIGNFINVLAILIGFSITCLTILATSSNEIVTNLKKYSSKRKIDGNDVSLYKLIFITFSFALLIEIFTLLFNLLYFIIYSSGCVQYYSKILFTFNVFMLLQVISINIRNVVNFYFIHWNDKINVGV